MFAPSFFNIVQKCFQPLFSGMKRMFYRCCFTVPSFKNGKKSHFVPEIQDSTRYLPGLLESRISGLKNTFYTGNTGAKRILDIVKMLRRFTSFLRWRGKDQRCNRHRAWAVVREIAERNWTGFRRIITAVTARALTVSSDPTAATPQHCSASITADGQVPMTRQQTPRPLSDFVPPNQS